MNFPSFIKLYTLSLSFFFWTFFYFFFFFHLIYSFALPWLEYHNEEDFQTNLPFFLLSFQNKESFVNVWLIQNNHWSSRSCICWINYLAVVQWQLQWLLWLANFYYQYYHGFTFFYSPLFVPMETLIKLYQDIFLEYPHFVFNFNYMCIPSHHITSHYIHGWHKAEISKLFAINKWKFI